MLTPRQKLAAARELYPIVLRQTQEIGANNLAMRKSLWESARKLRRIIARYERTLGHTSTTTAGGAS